MEIGDKEEVEYHTESNSMDFSANAPTIVLRGGGSLSLQDMATVDTLTSVCYPLWWIRGVLGKNIDLCYVGCSWPRTRSNGAGTEHVCN